jgi:hypothetical protein
MPRALGRDRLDVAAGGRLVLTCEEPKGWHGRSPKMPTAAEHPGTAVRWEGGFYEVLEASGLPGGGAAYVLAAWDERHAMRVVATYNEATEAARAHERADAAHRADRHVLLWLLSPIVGSLPGHVQESFEREYNVPARYLSLASALPLWIAGWIALILRAAAWIGGAHTLPEPVLLFGIYLLAESTARLVVAFLQGRPIGTVVGTLLYEGWRQLGRGAAHARGRPVPREKELWDVDIEPEQELLDRYRMVEPAAGLLAAPEQAVLAERYGFDGIRWGRLSAIFLLVMFGPLAFASLLGAFVEPEPSDLWRIPLFGGLVLEQVFRLARLRHGRLAPSLLGILVKPFAKPLLA